MQLRSHVAAFSRITSANHLLHNLWSCIPRQKVWFIRRGALKLQPFAAYLFLNPHIHVPAGTYYKLFLSLPFVGSTSLSQVSSSGVPIGQGFIAENSLVSLSLLSTVRDSDEVALVVVVTKLILWLAEDWKQRYFLECGCPSSEVSSYSTPSVAGHYLAAYGQNKSILSQLSSQPSHITCRYGLASHFPVSKALSFARVTVRRCIVDSTACKQNQGALKLPTLRPRPALKKTIINKLRMPPDGDQGIWLASSSK